MATLPATMQNLAVAAGRGSVIVADLNATADQKPFRRLLVYRDARRQFRVRRHQGRPVVTPADQDRPHPTTARRPTRTRCGLPALDHLALGATVYGPRSKHPDRGAGSRIRAGVSEANEGIIFNLLEDVVVAAHGDAMWDELLDEST